MPSHLGVAAIDSKLHQHTRHAAMSCVYCLPLGLEHSASTVKQHCMENQVDWDAYWASEKRRRTDGSGGSSESAGGGDYSSGSRDGASSSAKQTVPATLQVAAVMQ